MGLQPKEEADLSELLPVLVFLNLYLTLYLLIMGLESALISAVSN